MADEGTFLGEVQRGWQRFWRLSWWWKGPIIAFVALVLIGVVASIAGGGSDDKKPDSQARATTTVSATAPATATKETASPTKTPAPTATPEDTTEPTPAPTSEPTETPLDMVGQVTKSYKDNQGFMPRASADDLNVQWLPELGGLVKIEMNPETVLTEGDSLTITAHSALVASKAIWTTYPEVQQIEVTMLGDFIDQFGVSSTKVAASITVLRPTGEKFQYDGLKDLVYLDNKHLFCVADHYQIHLAIYQALGDKGCLAEWGFGK
ncbi:MAG: hypothetical protein Q7T33_15705 [Dehalococcoidia bacterium]|nr:hypothetical protein [Dehalococcoidia bacterium]